MKFFKSLANEFIDTLNMRDEARDWMLIISWLILAVLFLAGSGVLAIVTMWQTYGAASLILDLLIGIPAVGVFVCVVITYMFIAHELNQVLREEEESDYYD